jgi:hypothetical protein
MEHEKSSSRVIHLAMSFDASMFSSSSVSYCVLEWRVMDDQYTREEDCHLAMLACRLQLERIWMWELPSYDDFGRVVKHQVGRRMNPSSHGLWRCAQGWHRTLR